MELIDFTNATEIAPEYTGSEKKKTMILNNKKYLVKFPDPNRSTKLDISYINNVFPSKIKYLFVLASHLILTLFGFIKPLDSSQKHAEL